MKDPEDDYTLDAVAALEVAGFGGTVAEQQHLAKVLATVEENQSLLMRSLDGTCAPRQTDRVTTLAPMETMAVFGSDVVVASPTTPVRLVPTLPGPIRLAPWQGYEYLSDPEYGPWSERTRSYYLWSRENHGLESYLRDIAYGNRSSREYGPYA